MADFCIWTEDPIHGRIYSTGEIPRVGDCLLIDIYDPGNAEQSAPVKRLCLEVIRVVRNFEVAPKEEAPWLARLARDTGIAVYCKEVSSDE